MAQEKIRVKIISKNPLDRAQFFDLPQHYPQIAFILDRTARDYDWLVVYDDLPPSGDERLTLNEEHLAGGAAQSLLLTYEPPYLKFYGRDYTHQYGVVLTSHSPDTLPHPQRVDTPPVGYWYYGDYADAMRHSTPPQKTELLSVFASGKQMAHTLHAQRYFLLQSLQTRLADCVHIFGKGHRPAKIKAEALDDYRYHIAVENYVGAHHWTEKLSDCFLGYTLPFYAGCTNATDYFPPESFIPIDMRDPTEAERIIRAAIAEGAYEKRLPAIIEARRRVLEDYNLGNVIARAVLAHHPATRTMSHKGVVLSRHKMMRKSIGHFLRYGFGKMLMRRRGRRKWRAYLR